MAISAAGEDGGLLSDQGFTKRIHRHAVAGRGLTACKISHDTDIASGVSGVFYVGLTVCLRHDGLSPMNLTGTRIVLPVFSASGYPLPLLEPWITPNMMYPWDTWE